MAEPTTSSMAWTHSEHNEGAYVMAYDMRDGKMTPEKTRLINSSLASQAVGPPGSDFEMTCRGKAFKTMGRKLLRLPPLGLRKFTQVTVRSAPSVPIRHRTYGPTTGR